MIKVVVDCLDHDRTWIAFCWQVLKVDCDTKQAIRRKLCCPGLDERFSFAIKILVKKRCRIHRVKQLSKFAYPELKVMLMVMFFFMAYSIIMH
ncbi:hypothetical protein PS903_02291 [Pseudomonas fluorescens]|nr:hypothetical protein PS903_02291 [Pseudomonas fluorescens]